MIQLQEGTVIADRFRLVRMIGQGGMGSVWHSVHIGLDTPCALKFIEGELSKVAEAHERFSREAKVSAQLRSPNIVAIIDHGVWQERPYIAMELLEGVDLSKKIAQSGGRLPASAVNMVIGQVCRALTKAHGAGIVHRDLKPDNIFIVNDDDREIVKILDFGVAKATGQLIENSNTKTGAMLGTPYYMSPEQAQGIKSVDARSDLWSVAVIAYQCITGKLPFESEALGDLLVKIIVQPIPVPSQVASVPAGFDKWWAKAADRNPDNRFQTAKELAQQLELALGVTTGMAPPPSDPKMATMLMTPDLTPHAPTPQPVMTPYSPPANPATFSGVEPPIAIPKKGVPLSIVAVFAVLVLVGVAGAGVAVTKSRSAAAGPTATIVATKEAPPPTVATVATPIPTLEKTADIPLPEPTASASAEPETKPAIATTHTATTAAPATTAVKPAPTGSAKKKWDPGF